MARQIAFCAVGTTKFIFWRIAALQRCNETMNFTRN
jgi:hypothetical protein